MGGKYPAYPAYKDSAVEWLGPIPCDWSTCGVWMMFELGRGRVISNEEIADNIGKYPVYSSQTTDDGVMGCMDTYDFDGNFITWTTDGANAGTVFTRSGRFNCTNVCGTLKANSERINIRFYTYALSVATAWFVRHDINPKLMNNVMSAIRVPFFEFSEQQSIANFLDHETAKIDTMIDKQQQLIKLLKEKRQAVISHAVTKGLNPAAPMKDSGVEWLGEVPEHWGIVPLKYVVSELDGIQMGPFGGMLLGLGENETGYKVFGQENTISGDFTKGSRWIDKDRFEELSNYHLKVGDIILTRKGSLGNARLVTELAVMGVIDSDTIRIRINSRKLLPKLMSFLMHNARYVSEQIVRNRRGAILPGLNTETISNILLIVPHPSNQRELFKYLQLQNNKFDSAVEKCISAIELLQERRTALISAAVTGKIDVRNWQPAQTEIPGEASA